MMANFTETNLMNYVGVSNVRNQDGDTALTFAIMNEHEDIAQEMIRHGADVNQSDDNNFTPLVAAILFSSSDLVKFIISHGAELNHHDPDIHH